MFNILGFSVFTLTPCEKIRPPFHDISFVLKNNASVKLEIYDLTGSLITSLLNEEKTSGYHNVSWDGTNKQGTIVSSGNYIYRLSINSGKEKTVKSRKMTFLK